MTACTIAPHKDGYKIIASWTEHQGVRSHTRHGFRAVAQASIVYYIKTMAEAEREVSRLQARRQAA